MKRVKMNAGVIVVLLTVALVLSAVSFAWCGSIKKQAECEWPDSALLTLAHREMLNLSDEQVAKLEDLGYKAQKELIKANADIEIVAVDIRMEIKKDVIDIKTVNKLLDQQYSFKKEKAKAAIGTCAAVKVILTPEQRSLIKELQGDARRGGASPKMSGRWPMGASCPKGAMPDGCPMMKSSPSAGDVRDK